MRSYFAVVGALCLGGAFWLAVRRFSLLVHGVKTTGRVESFESREDDGSLMYLPVVSFTDDRGETHRFTSVAGGSSRNPPVGSVVTVRYRRDDPATAFIASFLHMWAAPVALAVLGTAAIVAFLQ